MVVTLREIAGLSSLEACTYLLAWFGLNEVSGMARNVCSIDSNSNRLEKLDKSTIPDI